MFHVKHRSLSSARGPVGRWRIGHCPSGLFADTEVAENHFQDIFHIHAAREAAQLHN